MTKQVRIENADADTHKLLVQVWEKNHEEGKPDIHVADHQLTYPTALLTNYVTATRYLVVKELPNETPSGETDGRF